MFIGEHTISKHQEKSLIIPGEIIDKCSNEKTGFTDSLSLSQPY
jgi:hypothetical protein